MIILIAGMLGISPELYEAADIDGATGAQQFFRITLPNLKMIILYVLVTSLIGGLNIFDIPRLFNNGGPDAATTSVAVFIYQWAFMNRYQYALAAAASMLLFVVVAILGLALFFALRDTDAAKMNKAKRELRRAEKRREALGK